MELYNLSICTTESNKFTPAKLKQQTSESLFFIMVVQPSLNQISFLADQVMYASIRFEALSPLS